ncbi:MAG: hypothetical protein HY075_06450 [Deltaproteobacteria bacterium]|nr:hypothetical protein [Deltaproteobacteria bacterium]
MLTTLLSVAALAAPAAPAFDPYNAYLWNKANRDRHNGKVDRGDWFEWWYYKVVPPKSETTSDEDAFYFVYGIVNPWDEARSNAASRAYVGFGSFADKRMAELRLAPGEFRGSYDSTDVRVGGANVATDRALVGRVDDVEWNIALERDWTFNAMGWAMSKDWLFNIYWYPAQASAFMTGDVRIGDRKIHLDHAPAYQDRNWGTSFPAWWTWIVSNNFKSSPGTVLAAGGGRPKLAGGFDAFEGVTIGLRLGGSGGPEYAFRPVDGDRVRVDVSFGKWEVVARNSRGEEIRISAFAPREKFMDLKFATPQGQVFHDFEALRGHVSVKLYKRLKLVAALESDDAGIEYGSADAHALENAFGDGRAELFR